MTELQIHPEVTPNPQSMKFVVNRPIASISAEFKQGQPTSTSPLAKKLFGFPWTESVFIGRDFVTVTKQDWVDWETLTEPLAGLIAEHIERGEGVLIDAPSGGSRGAGGAGTGASGVGCGSDGAAAGENSTSGAGNAIQPGDSELVQVIKKVLNDEIRPAVAMDGGDVVFSKYEDRIVYLHMQGSCSGCPSSAYTLKEGIATRLRNAIPEIIDVVAVE